jgi:hypothetical protein
VETTLVVVTLISVAVAVTASVVAWRVVREDRRRSAARIAALELELAGSDDPVSLPEAVPAPPPVPLRHSVPEPAPLRHDAAPPVEASRPGALAGLGTPSDPPRAVDGVDDLFATTQREGSGWRVAAVFAAAALLVIGGLAAAFLWRGAGPAASAETIAAGAPALELVSLRHARTGQTWTITGLVRNGADTRGVEGLSAVAFLFDGSGGFVASGRAPLEFDRLAPGDESPFVITVETPARVARYRVSFRSADGRTLRHLDRRSDAADPRS